jgi:Ni,Fe-hydrogenase III small subunit
MDAPIMTHEEFHKLARWYHNLPDPKPIVTFGYITWFVSIQKDVEPQRVYSESIRVLGLAYKDRVGVDILRQMVERWSLLSWPDICEFVLN